MPRPLVLVLVLVLVAAARDARAQDLERERETPLKIEAVAAFGYDAVPPGWLPVRVTVQNVRSSDRDRFAFRLAAKGGYTDQVHSTAIREETIPPGQTKRFWMYVYHDADNLDLRLESSYADAAGGHVQKSVQWERLAVAEPGNQWQYSSTGKQKEPLRIGVLSGRNPAALNILRSLELPNRIQAETAPLEPDELPDRRIGLAPFDLLVLNAVDFARLTPEQIEALRAWTLGGGRLLVSPSLDASWLEHPFFRDLLPDLKAKMEERTEFEGRKVAPYTALVVESPANDEDASARRSSLLTRGIRRLPAGLGEVILLPVDVAGAPLHDAPDDVRAQFWTAVMQAFQPRQSRNMGKSWPVAVPQRVNAAPHHLLVPEQEAPVLAIAAFALLYVGVVGPANFLLLRRAGREPLVVATIPAIAVAFVLGTFAVGYLWRGGRAEVFEATLIHARAGQRYALDERLAALIPPRAMTLEARLGAGEEGAPVSTQDGDAAERGFTIDTRDRVILGGLSPARWEACVVRSESIRDLEGLVSVTPRRDGGVDVKNGSGLELRRIVVRTSEGVHFGGPIKPGGEGTVKTDSNAESLMLDEVRGALGRDRLEARAFQHAVDWVTGRQGRFALAAILDPETAPPPRGREPAPSERVALLLLEP